MLNADIPRYDPTNVGQITLTDLFDNHAAAVAVLAVGFGLCTWGTRKLWGSGERIVAFEGEPDSETSPTQKNGCVKEVSYKLLLPEELLCHTNTSNNNRKNRSLT